MRNVRELKTFVVRAACVQNHFEFNLLSYYHLMFYEKC